MAKTVSTVPPQPDDWLKWLDGLKAQVLIPFGQSIRAIGISRPTALAWISAGVLPRAVQPMKGKGRGRLYFRKSELRKALEAL
jgi:hypothetical protein